MQEPDFLEYIGNKVVILGHHNADLDAIGSAVGVKELIQRLRPESVAVIVMPDDISKLSMQIIKLLDLEIEESYSGLFDTIVIVDTGSLTQIGSWENRIKEEGYVVVHIDHHLHYEQMSKHVDLHICNDEASSTSEIVYNLFEKYELVPSKITSKALLSGIYFDSKSFSIGKSSTFLIISKLLKHIEDFSEIKDLFHKDILPSEKIARLKAAQRIEIHRVDDWIIVFSEVNSFHASCARGLVSLGADIAIVSSSDDHKLRSSLRSTEKFYNKTGVHLGELVNEMSTSLKGAGSGHPSAAGFNGIGHLKDLKNILYSLIKIKLDNQH
jgi:nanoRNase/pAp phosphatase (c-di-AMP/oligoRNAs hydrolase)